MYHPRKVLVAFIAALSSSLASAQHSSPAPGEVKAATVVFVCEHGNGKSLIGASLYEQAAKKRGLSLHAVSRGTNPDAGVPPKIAQALRGSDGVEVGDFIPQPLTATDVARAARVVAISVNLSAFDDKAQVPIERWEDIPPASVNYAASRAALLRHIETLLDELH